MTRRQRNNGRRPDPTPQQIAKVCKAIRATWTAQERHKRLRVDWRGGEPETATVAVAELVGL